MQQPYTSPMTAEERRPLRLGLPTSVGLVLGALLLALGAAVWATRPPAEGSAEVRFARDMIAHHEQAVEMALIMRERTGDATVRIMADDIILTQQSQSGRMAGWLEAWGRPQSTTEPPMGGQGEAMGMAPQSAVNALGTLPVPAAEVSFLQLMITHHQGGVMMAEAALDAGVRPEVRRLAEAVVNGQQSEISLMTELLAARGASPPPPLADMHHHP